MADTLLTLRQAATILNCSYGKAQILAKSGKLPFRKLGATWVIPKSALFAEMGMVFDGEEAPNGKPSC